MEGQERSFPAAGHAGFDAAVPLREDGAPGTVALAGLGRRPLEPRLERHGALRETGGHAGAAARYLPDRAHLRARLCRFPFCRLRLAQGLSEARCLPRENAGAAFRENLAAAAGLNGKEFVMSLKFTAGDLTIHRIIEQETTFLPALDLFPELTPDLLAENRDWMRKARAIDENDTL